MGIRYDKLLVLDLDETLVHGSETAMARPPAARVGPYFIYHRPGVQAFLNHVLARFEVAIWTASTRSYAEPVLASLLDTRLLAFVWTRSRCTMSMDRDSYEYVLRKDIRKLRRRGYAREAILFVDDTPAKISRSYGNYIHIRPYEGAPADDELRHLAAYLDELGPLPKVRNIEKRGWRTRAAPRPS